MKMRWAFWVLVVMGMGLPLCLGLSSITEPDAAVAKVDLPGPVSDALFKADPSGATVRRAVIPGDDKPLVSATFEYQGRATVLNRMLEELAKEDVDATVYLHPAGSRLPNVTNSNKEKPAWVVSAPYMGLGEPATTTAGSQPAQSRPASRPASDRRQIISIYVNTESVALKELALPLNMGVKVSGDEARVAERHKERQQQAVKEGRDLKEAPPTKGYDVLKSIFDP